MAVDRESTLGLSEAEIIWLRANKGSNPADGLIRQYHMVCTAPNDPGARGIFNAMLAEARKTYLAGLR